MKEQNQTDEMSRLSRLIAILIILQSKRIITASDLAKRFDVTARTIYRDIRTLEQAGVPILTEEGKGFTMMTGFKLPPFLFTEKEAAAIVIAEKFIVNNSDSSLVKNYSDAAAKIKAVLPGDEKDKMELLSSRLKIYSEKNTDKISSDLSSLQFALTNYFLIKLRYHSVKKEDITERIVEPFALFHTNNCWMLVAFCRSRNDYRIFRLDRFLSFQILDEKFQPHKISVSKYLESFKKSEIHP
jgi:predicted DNA-binding transcriptional regulator YafY